MKKLTICVLFVLTVASLLIGGCTSQNTSMEEGPSTTAAVISQVSPVDSISSTQPAKNEFSLITDRGYVSLQDADTNLNLKNILGDPLKEKLEKLNSNADTHSGSSINTLRYDGITLKLFSPPNGFFWVMNMKVDGKNFKTFRGIAVGNSVSELKNAYNDVVQVLDGRTDLNNCAYSFNQNELFIQFEVNNGIIKEIFYYVEIP